MDTQLLTWFMLGVLGGRLFHWNVWAFMWWSWTVIILTLTKPAW